MDWVIYTLKNPRTNQVRYVGKTSQSLDKRLEQHLTYALNNPARTYRNRGIVSLLSIGVHPVIEAIERGNGDTWKEAERRWIAYYRAIGVRLWNTTDGGDGVPNWGTPEQRSAKQKKTWENIQPERRSAIFEKVQRSRTPEQRSEAIKKGHAGSTLDQRRARIQKAVASRTPEQDRARMEKINARRTFEERSIAQAKGHARLTPEQRNALAEKIRAGVNAYFAAKRAAG